MQRVMNQKVVHLPSDLHHAAKIEAAKKNVTLKEYLAELVRKAVQAN